MPTGDTNGAMNPSAAPFIPLASSKPSFARQRAQRSRPGSQAERSKRDGRPPRQDQVTSSNTSQSSCLLHVPWLRLIHHATQIPRPSAPTSGRSVLQNPSGQPSVDSSKSSDHVPEGSQSKGEGGSVADGASIKSSGPSIGPDQLLKTPEAKVPPTQGMSGGNSTGAQPDGQNPNPHPEEMNSRGSGTLVFGSHLLTPLAQVANKPDGAGEEQTRSTSRDETTNVGRVQHLPETSIDHGSKTGSEPSAACQSNSRKTESPSAVDGRHTGEEHIPTSPQPQQNRHVPSSVQVASNSQSASSSQQQHNAAQEPAQQITNPSARYSRKAQGSDQLSHKAPVEPASWSQSKRWISSETKERKAFQKMMMNLQFMKADQSPFVPKSPAELTKFRITLAEAKRQKLAQEVSILEEKNRQKELAKASGTILVSQPHVALFNGRDMEDELSPVFAVQNCFNKQDTVEEKKAVESGSWNIPPVTSLNDGSGVSSQLELADLSEFMKEFMLDIQEHES
ncbi:hypothetical protein TgHK011_006315 [Trichoderma gracile]|nr:hypothetical protein TgHK011_006315 [Trichoderma gracile]